MADVINTNLTDGGTLEIYLGNALLARVEDGRDDEDFVEDVLAGMGYEWLEDGTVCTIEQEDSLVHERLEHYDFIMNNYLFTGAKLVEQDGASYIVEYEGKNLKIEFDPDWEELVYTVNGKGPFTHSSYEYLGQDCRQVLAIEEQEREKLAVKLNTFYKNFDHYGFMDCLDGEVTEEVLDEQLAEGLNDPETVASVLEELNEILEDGELDEEQLTVLNGLIKEVESIQASFATSLDDKLAAATEKSSHTENSNDKDISIERDALGE